MDSNVVLKSNRSEVEHGSIQAVSWGHRSSFEALGDRSDVLTCRVVWCINMSELKFNATPCVSNGHFRAWPSQSVYAYILLHDLNTNIRNPFEIVGWRSHFRCPSMFRGKCQGPFQILLVNHGLTRNIFCHQPVDRTQSSGEPPSFVLVLQLPVTHLPQCIISDPVGPEWYSNDIGS